MSPLASRHAGTGRLASVRRFLILSSLRAKVASHEQAPREERPAREEGQPFPGPQGARSRRERVPCPSRGAQASARQASAGCQGPCQGGSGTCGEAGPQAERAVVHPDA